MESAEPEQGRLFTCTHCSRRSKWSLAMYTLVLSSGLVGQPCERQTAGSDFFEPKNTIAHLRSTEAATRKDHQQRARLPGTICAEVVAVRGRCCLASGQRRLVKTMWANELLQFLKCEQAFGSTATLYPLQKRSVTSVASYFMHPAV
jgi:hypothetical protein